MRTASVICPVEAVLTDFSLGKLDAATADAVSGHLEVCADCRSRVACLPGDSFVARLRQAEAVVRSDKLPNDSTAGPVRVAADGKRTDLPAGFGRYIVTGLLGEGTFGVVYHGHDPELCRDVAIKVPHRERVSSPADADAYLAKARLLAMLDDPGIVAVYDFGRTEDGRCYVVSRYMPCGDLNTLLARRRLTVEEAVELAARIAEALDYAHQRGRVHRDIKPRNILLDQAGRPLLSDLGLALTDEPHGRAAGVFGTPAYMSPEQARGESHLVDASSDIYSLGVLFYEMLTGRRPYRAHDPRDLLAEIVNRDIRPPRQLDRTIPKELERICLNALSKLAANRYSTAFDLADDLRCWQTCTKGDRMANPRSINR